MRNEATSAMGNAHQIRLTLPFRLSSQAGGHQHKELAYQRDQQRHDAAAQGLEHRRRDDVEARDDEVDGDDAQSHLAQSEHIGAGVEDAEHDAGAELCGREAQQHDGHGGNHRHPDDLYNAPGFAGAVVVGDDGDHAVVEADEGHDDEALHLEVDAEHSHRGAGESDEEAVHAESHDAAHRGHGNGGDAYLVDAPDGTGLGPEILQAEPDVVVMAQIEVQPRESPQELPGHGGRGRAGGLHAGETEQPEDQDGVHDNIGQGPHQLGDHGVVGAPGGAEQLFHHALDHASQAEQAAHRQIVVAVLPDQRVGGLGVHEGLHAEQPEEEKTPQRCTGPGTGRWRQPGRPRRGCPRPGTWTRRR